MNTCKRRHACIASKGILLTSTGLIVSKELLYSPQDEWGWDRYDVARAMRHVLPGCRGPLKRQPTKRHASSNMKWEEVRAIADALGIAEAAMAPMAVASRDAVAPSRDMGDVDAICRAMEFAARGYSRRKNFLAPDVHYTILTLSAFRRFSSI